METFHIKPNMRPKDRSAIFFLGNAFKRQQHKVYSSAEQSISIQVNICVGSSNYYWSYVIYIQRKPLLVSHNFRCFLAKENFIFCQTNTRSKNGKLYEEVKKSLFTLCIVKNLCLLHMISIKNMLCEFCFNFQSTSYFEQKICQMKYSTKFVVVKRPKSNQRIQKRTVHTENIFTSMQTPNHKKIRSSRSNNPQGQHNILM